MNDGEKLKSQKSSKELRSITLYSNNLKEAMSIIRIVGPASFAQINIVNGVENGYILPEAVDDGDIIVIQRDICKQHALSQTQYDFELILSRARSQDKPVVFELDDLLIELPIDHPDRPYVHDALLPILQVVMEADLVTVTTEPLRDYLSPFSPNIAVIPNYLNDALWRFNEPSIEQKDKDYITIGYMGGPSHQLDLEMILPALKIINEKYPKKLKYHFWGIKPPKELKSLSRVDWAPPPSSEYQAFVKFFQTQTADIAIAPLCNNLLNTCKSHIKFLEYSAIGVPGVYSRITPFSNIISHGEDAFLATSMDDWVNMLSQLIEDSNLRLKFAKNAQTKIRQSWLLSKNFQKQIEIYRQLINTGRGPQTKSAILHAIRNISTQHYEEQFRNRQNIHNLTNGLNESKQKAHLLTNEVQSLTNDVQSLTNDVQSLTNDVQSLNLLVSNRQEIIEAQQQQMVALNDEMAGYLVSSSWRYTRPLRNISRLIHRVINRVLKRKG